MPCDDDADCASQTCDESLGECIQPGSVARIGDRPDDCEVACSDQTCGDDGCGGTCGTCAAGLSCLDGHCESVECQPECDGKNCGPDGCGGNCGLCQGGHDCVAGLCTAPPVEDPLVSECGAGLACVDECQGNSSCIDGCVTAMDGTGQVMYSALASCVQANCSGGLTPAELVVCQYTTCAAVGYDCYEVVPPGVAGCATTHSCLTACTGNKPALCTGQCAAAAAEASMIMYWQLMACVVDECGLPFPAGCDGAAMTGPCADLWAVCQADG